MESQVTESKNKMPMLSIVMPVYNVAKYLPKALDSILKQTFKDWELVAVDDGSIDGSGEIIDVYAEKDKRIRAFHKSNGGATLARVDGVKLSFGQIVTFFDADDWIEPDMYERMLRYMHTENLDIVVGGHIEEVRGDIRQPYKATEEQVFSSTQAQVELLSHKHHAWGMCDKLYRRHLFRQYNLSQRIVCGEDLLTNWMVYKKAKRIGYTPVYGYHYVKHNDSLTTAEYSWKRYTIMLVLEEIAKDKPMMVSEVRQAFDSAWRSRALGAMTGMVISGKNEFKQELSKLQGQVRADLCGCLLDPYLSNVRKILACYFALPIPLYRVGRSLLIWGERMIKK